AEKLAELLGIDGVEVAAEELLLEALPRLHLAHQLEGLGVAERARAVEQVSVPALEVLQVPDVLQLVAQRLVERLGFGVLELVVGERRQRVRQAWRGGRELLAPAPRPLL